MKKIYFLSDAHLGSWAIPNGREQERRLVRFLDSIKDDAAAVYLLGDLFDFWHEYRYVVPKGYTRFLGKLYELTEVWRCISLPGITTCGAETIWRRTAA